MPAALRAAGLRVEVHHDHFGDTVADDVWLRTVSARGWVVLTHDNAIRKDPLALEAIYEANGRIFIVRGTLTAEAKAELVLAAAPKMAKLLEERLAPFIALIMPESLPGGRFGARVKVRAAADSLRLAIKLGRGLADDDATDDES